MSSKYFKSLNYSLGDEDSNIEYNILEHNQNHIMGIAGSGGRILPLLARNPNKLTCVDILDEQLFLTEMRCAAIKILDYSNFRAFLGYPPIEMLPLERRRIFRQLELSERAKFYLEMVFEKAGWSEIIYIGKFEKTLITLSKINRLITGRQGQMLFNNNNLPDQVKYLTTHFPRQRWNLVLRLLGNTSVLNSLLYKGDFPKKNIPGSYFENFRRIFDQIFYQMDVNKSFFAQLCFFGKLINERANPIEVNKDVFEGAKQGLKKCEVSYINGDIMEVIQKTELKSLDFISLSDVPSFMTGDTEFNYLQMARPHLSNSGKVVVRGNLRVTRPLKEGFAEISSSYKELFKQESTQLWNINVYQQKLPVC